MELEDTGLEDPLKYFNLEFFQREHPHRECKETMLSSHARQRGSIARSPRKQIWRQTEEI
jgi:hypothetical protein